MSSSTSYVDSRWSVVVSKHPSSRDERPTTVLNPSLASAPAWYAPANESSRSDPSATTWSAPSAHCCQSSSAPPAAGPACERRSSCHCSPPAKPHPLVVNPAAQSHSAHPAPSNARLNWYRSATRTSALRARASRPAPRSANPPNPSALPSCNCCAPQTTATAGCADRSASPAVVIVARRKQQQLLDALI